MRVRGRGAGPGLPRRQALIRWLDRVPGFATPDPRLEQVVTPSDAAADLLLEALARGDLTEQSVVDLGSGTGRLAIGAALLGARPVVAFEISPEAVALARHAAAELGVLVTFENQAVPANPPEGTVVMNTPFGAQRRGADRPFWAAALRPGRRAVYAFASAESRTFIERLAVAHSARIERIDRVPWAFPATFGHHRRRSVALDVDRWILRTGADDA
jgi:putative methylase